MVWSGPLIIVISTCMLSNLLGFWPTLSGIIVMLLVIPTNLRIGDKLKSLQKDQMLQKDERIKYICETIEGIKLIKLYAWEEYFKQQILLARKREMGTMKWIAVYRAFNYISWIIVPLFVSLASFGIYILLNSDHQSLTIEVIFVAITLFNIMKYPLQMFPTVITGLIVARESLKRIDNFLNAKEQEIEENFNVENEKHAIKITNGNFKWDICSEQNTLSNINLTIQKGRFVAVVGSTASG